MKFDATSKELEVAPDAHKVTAEFHFKNEGTEVETIEKYEAGCTCINAQIKGGKLEYQPGEEGVVRAEFDMTNFTGTVDKGLVLIMKGKPAVNLTARIKIPELVKVEPRTVSWEVGEDAAAKTVRLTMQHEKPIKVLRVSGANSNFSYELKTVEEGKIYEITLTPKTTDQVGLGVFHIDTDCEIPRHRAQRVFTVVRQPAAKLNPESP